MTDVNDKKWYAMSSPYGREMKVVELLKNESDVTTFVPVRRYERMVGRKSQVRKISERPVIRNLLFVQATEPSMRTLKGKYNQFLQFKMRPKGKGYEPIVVPNKDMESFIAICTHANSQQLKFYKPEEIKELGLRPESKVRIEDGIFAGKEGYYQRIKGTRSKRFVVKIDDFLACSAVLVECRYVKVEK